MGGSSSKDPPSDSEENTPDNASIKTLGEGPLPYVLRIKALKTLLEHIQSSKSYSSDDEEWTKVYTNRLEAVCNEFYFEEKHMQDTVFLVDQISWEALTLLNSLPKGDGKRNAWTDTASRLCVELVAHINVSKVPGIVLDVNVTNLRKLILTNVHFISDNSIENFIKVIDSNPRLWKVDLSFTAIDTTRVREIFPYLAKLKELSYIGLRGNRIDNSIVPYIQKILKNKATLPKLLWIDLANNVDIVILPKSYLALLKVRWPKSQGSGDYEVTFRDVADGRVGIDKNEFMLNV